MLAGITIEAIQERTKWLNQPMTFLYSVKIAYDQCPFFVRVIVALI
jgi:hypothetical protein